MSSLTLEAKASKVLSKSIKEVIFCSDRNRYMTDIVADVLNFTKVASNDIKFRIY